MKSPFRASKECVIELVTRVDVDEKVEEDKSDEVTGATGGDIDSKYSMVRETKLNILFVSRAPPSIPFSLSTSLTLLRALMQIFSKCIKEFGQHVPM